jgi:hypothetical protein
MKTTTYLAIGALLGSATCLVAQDQQERQERRGQRGAPSPEMIKEFDKDGDGQLSDEERTAMREAMRTRMEQARKAALEKYDANKDGQLDQDERAKMREDLTKEFDKDGDGQLNQEERRALQQSGRGWGVMGRGPGGREGREGRQGRRGQQQEQPREQEDPPAENGGDEAAE